MTTLLIAPKPSIAKAVSQHIDAGLEICVGGGDFPLQHFEDPLPADLAEEIEQNGSPKPGSMARWWSNLLDARPNWVKEVRAAANSAKCDKALLCFGAHDWAIAWKLANQLDMPYGIALLMGSTTDHVLSTRMQMAASTPSDMPPAVLSALRMIDEGVTAINALIAAWNAAGLVQFPVLRPRVSIAGGVLSEVRIKPYFPDMEIHHDRPITRPFVPHDEFQAEVMAALAKIHNGNDQWRAASQSSGFRGELWVRDEVINDECFLTWNLLVHADLGGSIASPGW